MEAALLLPRVQALARLGQAKALSLMPAAHPRSRLLRRLLLVLLLLLELLRARWLALPLRWLLAEAVSQ
jgi:hypothetical protein